METNDNTILVVGLGNPGKQYEKTRHNLGFMALDFFVEKNYQEEKFTPNKAFDALLLEIKDLNKKIIFAKPQTFMNLSGKSVSAITNFYKINPSKVITVQDELDLPFGKIKISRDSSSAGHNGIQSIIDHLGTKDFYRIRIGIKKETCPNDPTEKFVLKDFDQEESENMQKIMEESSKFILELIETI